MTSLPESSEAKAAYAAAYAGLRIAQTIHIAELRRAIESRAINLLTGMLDADSRSFLKNIKDMEYMMALGRDAGVIHYQTAELMFDELQKLKSGNSATDIAYNQIAGLPDSAGAPKLTGADLFPDFKNSDKEESAKESRKVLAENDSAETYLIRQSAIINLIRQSGNCRLRDLQIAMPNISERTLRYDLQNLVQKGAILRIGQGGPATHYCLKESAVA